jgi:hypothetical protein
MNVFVLLKDEKIKRISISQEIQKQLEDYLKDSINQFLIKERIDFDGQYKPDNNQILSISNYNINFLDKLVVDAEILLENDIEQIKCIIFFYNNSKIGFQLFDNRKIINPSKFSLIYDSKTFSRLNSNGITISNTIDVLFDNNQLLFVSYHNASRIFNLSEYYREASDAEIDNLRNSDVIEFSQDIDNNQFDSIMRKKLFLIKKNKVVDIVKSNFEAIISYAKDAGMDEYFKDEKIFFPSDKKKLKRLINFLNDDLFKSPITNLIYETNSKRAVK